MTFGPLDGAMLFVSAALLTFRAAYVMMRSQMDLVTWATLTGASMPPSVYFPLRAGGGLPAVLEVVAAVGVAWAVYLQALRLRNAATRAAVAAATAKPRKPPRPISADLRRQAAGYGLLGLGWSLCFAISLISAMLFLPGRHRPPSVAFQLDHPAFLICGSGLLAGLTLIAAGRWVMRVRP